MKIFSALMTFFLIIGLTLNVYASNGIMKIATGDTYFDIATGHKYIKNSETTYAEYSKKGQLLRDSVSHSLPLLVTNKYIREIDQDCYFLYVKAQNGVLTEKVLPASKSHPAGWSCKTVMISVPPASVKIGLGYSNLTSSFKYDGKQLIATGNSYFDIATGHKYIKNSEITYAEYSKKGKLLRDSIPNTLPVLTRNKYIVDIGQNSSLLYQKSNYRQSKLMVLPSKKNHPQGWSSEKVLIDMN